MTIHARSVSADELSALTQLARSRTRGAGLVRRAQIVLYGVEGGLGAPEIAGRMGLSRHCVRFWLKRFNEHGLAGLHEAPRYLHRRGAQHGNHHRPDRARRSGPAVRLLDVGSPGHLFGPTRRRHAAQPDFLGRIEAWVDPAVERIYVVLDNLSTHTAVDVLLFNLAHPRWEFVFQPKYAAYLNLIEPWWKVLRSLVLKGRRFDAWAKIEQAVEKATACWNAHKHPFIWGRRRRHQTAKRFGVAALPNVALI